MRKFFFPFLLIYSVISLVSCKKDASDPPVNSNFLGNYKFVSLFASTVNTETFTDGTTLDKSISKADYITKNNTGTLTIEATKMISADLSYSVDTTGTIDYYEDGVFVDTYELPFQVDVPVSSGTMEYKWITSDSIYFPKGSILLGGTPTPSEASGAKFTLTGDKLYISGGGIHTSQRTDAGLVINSVANIKFVATYQKQ